MLEDLIDKIALIHISNGRLLSTRSKGKDVFYVPGGKREPGETDRQALVREIREELGVALDVSSLDYFNTFEGEAHGHSPGTLVRLTCYRGTFTGLPMPSSEIEELMWLKYQDRPLCALVDRYILDWLKDNGELI